jgi:hypothetical protein
MEIAAKPVFFVGFWERIARHIKDHFVPHERNHYAPHMLHHRTLVGFSVLLLSVKIASVALLQFSPSDYVEASAITPSSVFELTNQSRAQNQVGQLTYSKLLEQVAQAKANDMLARQYFAHNTPDGKTPWYFFDLGGYKYLSAGENLAVHFSDVEPLQDAWMNSPGHRANIVNTSFKEMGVGIARGQFEGHDSIFVVEEFGNPAQAAVTTTPSEVKTLKPQTAEAAPLPVPAPAKAQTVPSSAPAKNVDVPTKAPASPIAVAPTRQEATPLSIGVPSISTTGNQLSIETSASSNVSKLLLTYGQKAQFFKPQANGTWSVSLPLESVGSETLTIEAFDIQGRTAISKVASIAPTFAARYQTPDGNVKAASIEVFGQKLPVQPLEQKAYLGIIALLLGSMVIAIAVHRHLQHVRLLANSAFVVAFAALLLLF